MIDLRRMDEWHLHVTVEPRDREAAQQFRKACDAVGWRPLIIENVAGDRCGDFVTGASPVTSWIDLIPSTKITGELGAAMVAVNKAALYFMLMGWTVRREKIEGRKRAADSMYCEAHVHLDSVPLKPHTFALSRSQLSGKLYGTIRDDKELGSLPPRTELEWIAYDSNRAMDRPWLASWGRKG